MGKANDNLNPSNIWAGTGYATDGSSNADTPSRLSESTAALRQTLMTRNLYTEFVQYPLQETDRQKIVNTISTVIDTVAPFNSFNLTDSVVGRVASAPTTPLSEIGLVMLGKQLTNNFKSNLGQAAYQSVVVRNLFDGDPDTLFRESRDFRITKKEDAGTLEKFTERYFGYNPGADNPFDGNPTTEELINNTGAGQLDFLFGDGKTGGGINKNIYKSADKIYGEDGIGLIQPRSFLVGAGSRTDTVDTGIRKYFDSFITNPYKRFATASDDSVENANKAMDTAYYDVSIDSELNTGQEYAPTQVFVEEAMGFTNVGRERSLTESGINVANPSENIGEHNDEDNQKIVWGETGVGSKANARLAGLRGIDNLGENASEGKTVEENDDLSKFKVKFGLLKYTSELLNSTKGQVVDQTRKIFKKGDRVVGLNGSGLFTSPDNSLFKGAQGLRQHSVLDQYDRFAKAIRFEGNQVYAGNPDSVVYNSVLPRIHPVLNDKGGVENKNLTFSLENLAVKVIDDEVSGFGMIDDGEGTLIPKCEAGPFGGRLMWFPPYIENLNEVAIANHDSVVMIGRNEPIYNYMHSERTANLTFKLIIDYPEHVKNFTDYRDVANFFAFGGENLSTPPATDPVKPPTPPKPKPKIPEIEEPTDLIFSFPNDRPYKDNRSNSDDPIDYTLIDKLYNDVRYDIKKGLDNTADIESYTINDKVFLVTGVTESVPGKYELNVPAAFSQSQAPYISGQRQLDDNIYLVFNAPDNYKYYEIEIRGGATELYTEANEEDQAAGDVHNNALAQRRADTIESFVKQRIAKVLGKKFESTNIIITTFSDGAKSDQYDTKASIPEEGAHKERIATIQFKPRTATTDATEENLTSEEQREKEAQIISDQNAQATSNISQRNNNCVINERGINDSAILNDFKSITKDYFYPAFHSQTPEDFHKRLTFLQQCVRQGSAIRSNPEVDENGITRAKNSVFGRQPVCILRIGDFYYTKVIINNVTIDYDENIWDTNPEGMGMQPMVATVTLQMKVIGGQSLKGPVDALQNAVAYNYYANSTFAKNGEKGVYTKATKAAEDQQAYRDGIKAREDAERNKNK